MRCPYMYNYKQFDEKLCCTIEGSLKNEWYLDNICNKDYKRCTGYNLFKTREETLRTMK